MTNHLLVSRVEQALLDGRALQGAPCALHGSVGQAVQMTQHHRQDANQQADQLDPEESSLEADQANFPSELTTIVFQKRKQASSCPCQIGAERCYLTKQ
nr:hypothetical protein [Acetobacter fabarum]